MMRLNWTLHPFIDKAEMNTALKNIAEKYTEVSKRCHELIQSRNKIRQ